MLDDLKYIHQRDGQDALGVAEKQWQQLQQKYEVDLSGISGVENAVLAGMGGSALPGVFLQSWPGLNVPFEIVRNYNLPKYVGAKTLFISSSYSGNTEETLSALAEAEAKNAQIVVIAAGGKLAEIAKEKSYPLFMIPSGIQPRMSAFYFLAAFTQLLEPLKLIDAGSVEQLAKAGEWLKDQTGSWRPDVATKDNLAKQTAVELAGKTVIMYAGPLMFPAANKWKIGSNENAKNLAWSNQYPEFNHNEFIGWSSHPVDKPFGVVDIRSNLEDPRIQKRFELSERLLSGKRPVPIVIKPQGETLLQQLLWSSVLGDFVTIYLALLNGVNPTPVDLVEKFKTELG
jgi:glucose/mannose-6-phosphate isomerase